MSTELAVRPHGALAITPDQTWWTDEQSLVLRQAGIDDDVTEAELRGFLHLCQRTELDPFTRQIYLIGRYDSRAQRKVFTPQTSIDGYRVVRDRVIARTHGTLSYDDFVWCGPDGAWRDVWIDDSVPPIAAKVTVYRDGGRFSAVAKFSEYAQTKGDKLIGLWARMPAGQLAKCAEALALRKAFPHDLAGVYTAEEMAQADNASTAEQRTQRQTARPVDDDPWQTPAPAQSAPAAVPVAEPEYAEVVEERGPALATQQQMNHLEEGLEFLRGASSDEARATAYTQILGHPVAAGETLTRPDAERVRLALVKEDEQRQQEAERDAAKDAPAVADRQEVDYVIGGFRVVRGIPDDARILVAIQHELGDELATPYAMTVEQAAKLRATLTAEHEANQQQAQAPGAKAQTNRQRAMHAAFNGAGIKKDDHTERIAYAGLVVGHAVASTNELTAAEVEQVIAALNSGKTLASLGIGKRAQELASMIASAQSSDELVEVSDRFWADHGEGAISDVERDVLISASGRREQQLAQQQKTAVAA